MARTSIRIPDGLLEDFDRRLYRLKADGEIPMDLSRSDAMRELMHRWVLLAQDSGDDNEVDCWPYDTKERLSGSEYEPVGSSDRD